MTNRSSVCFTGALLIVFATRAGGAEAVLPRVFCFSPQTLSRNKTRVAAEDEVLRLALEQLQTEAGAALETEIVSVVDNDLVPSSGDRHDYISFGPYWWPDPAKVDGLPYIRRDGEVNPESRSSGSDWPALRKMASAVQTLALAHYFTGDERHAEHAAKLLRAWFLHPKTKMNPHLNFGQAIPGRVEGRAVGIIDTVVLCGVIDAVGLLQGSPAWREQDQAGMVAWFAAYLDWLRNSTYGRQEAAAANNHGTWYDAQLAAFALFVGQDHLAQEVIEASRRQRIARHIEPDGRQPGELARTKPFSYSIFNLQAFFTLAALGERVGVDLWHYETQDGRSLQKALDFLADQADPRQVWPYKDLGYDRAQLIPLLQQGRAVYGERYEPALKKLPPQTIAQSRGQLLYDREGSANR